MPDPPDLITKIGKLAMRLFEKVVRASCPLLVRHPQLGQVELPGASTHARQVAGVDARYVLMDDMTRTCGGLILDQPELLADCADIIRVPSNLLWIEWVNWQLHPDSDQPNSEPQQRAGILVESEPGGRRGTIVSFWDGPDGGADRCPAILRFDFDDEALGVPKPSCPEVYRKLYARTEIVLDRDWQRYYAVAAPDALAQARVIDEVARTLGKDFAVLTAFSLMMSLRHELAFTRSDLDRLNRSRAKVGKQPLLDFTEVSARLFSGGNATHPSAGGAIGHRGPRLHHVRGHFVRRAQKIFWRRTHLRGDLDAGIAPVRTTRVGL